MFQIAKFARARWECVHFCESDQIGSTEDLAATGFEIFDIDLTEVATKEELLGSIAKAMRFPDYFGGNWDALDECLRDMSWAPAKGYLLMLRNSEGLWRRNPRIAAGLVQSWIFSAEEWAREDVPFHLVFAW